MFDSLSLSLSLSLGVSSMYKSVIIKDEWWYDNSKNKWIHVNFLNDSLRITRKKKFNIRNSFMDRSKWSYLIRKKNIEKENDMCRWLATSNDFFLRENITYSNNKKLKIIFSKYENKSLSSPPLTSSLMKISSVLFPLSYSFQLTWWRNLILKFPIQSNPHTN